MTATARLYCIDGCFEVEYTAADADTVNELGPPVAVQRARSACPECGGDVTVDWVERDE